MGGTTKCKTARTHVEISRTGEDRDTKRGVIHQSMLKFPIVPWTELLSTNVYLPSLDGLLVLFFVWPKCMLHSCVTLLIMIIWVSGSMWGRIRPLALSHVRDFQRYTTFHASSCVAIPPGRRSPSILDQQTCLCPYLFVLDACRGLSLSFPHGFPSLPLDRDRWWSRALLRLVIGSVWCPSHAT